jgi:hypothetical protein
MASTYTPNLRFELMATGENRSTWGNKANSAVFSLIEAAIAGYESIAMANGNVTLTSNNGAADQARKLYLNFTGTHTAIRTVTIPTVSKMYIMTNSTSGGFAITISNGSSTVNIAASETSLIWTDGTTVFKRTLAGAEAGSFSTLAASGATTLSSTLGVTGASTFTSGTFSTTLGVTGVLTASGGVTGAASYVGTGASVVLAPNSSGTIFLRPDGAAGTTNQVAITSTGNVTINGTLTITG